MAKRFRLAARGTATALIRDGASFEVPYSYDGVPIALTFRTRYFERGHSVKVPGDLWLDAVGDAADLQSAAAIFTNAGRMISAVMAVAANAAIAPLEVEIVVEVTPSVDKREYFQRYMPPDVYPHTSRFIDFELAGALVTAVAKHPEFDRLVRAIAQYSEALLRWRAGSELLALSHLFMGAEALKTAAWRSHVVSNDLTAEALAAEWGFEPEGRLSLATFLDREARVRLVFQNDVRCHKLARDTSDHFEHGAKNSGQLFGPASECLVPTASYLRRAIIAVSGVKAELAERMLADPYARPRGPSGVDTYIRGMLVGPGPELAAPQNEYPFLEWKADIKSIEFDHELEKYRFQPDHTLTGRFADSITLQELVFEMFDHSIFSPYMAPKSLGSDD